MTPEDLLDYSLGQCEGPALAAAEADLARDPALKARADRLELAIRNLLDDGDASDPPPGLASRTMAFVGERRSRRAILDFVPSRVPFRWADVAVAAGILLAGLLTLVPAVSSARLKMSQANCGFNLQQLYAGLANFAARHDHYPDVAAADSGGPVGTYAIQLDDEALLGDPRTLHCPCRGPCPQDGPRPDPRHIDYAYHVGYVSRESGKVTPMSPSVKGGHFPLLADQPPHDNRGTILPGNSPNHGGRGQNVLFSDGHIRWFPSRQIGLLDRDMFLNNADRPEPGLSPEDATLVPAVFKVTH